MNIVSNFRALENFILLIHDYDCIMRINTIFKVLELAPLKVLAIKLRVILKKLLESSMGA